MAPRHRIQTRGAVVDYRYNHRLRLQLKRSLFRKKEIIEEKCRGFIELLSALGGNDARSVDSTKHTKLVDLSRMQTDQLHT